MTTTDTKGKTDTTGTATTGPDGGVNVVRMAGGDTFGMLGTLRGLRQRGGDVWAEGSAEAFWYLLEVLPPIYLPGGNHMCSEPADRCPVTGETVYTAAVKLRGRYYYRDLTVREYGPAFRRLVLALQAGTLTVREG